jgi:hypothetical protein
MYESCVESTRPHTPRMTKARMLSPARPRIVSAPERASSATRKADAMTPRTAVRNTGGKSARASLPVAGNVPHSVAMSRSAA